MAECIQVAGISSPWRVFMKQKRGRDGVCATIFTLKRNRRKLFTISTFSLRETDNAGNQLRNFVHLYESARAINLGLKEKN